MQRYVIIIKIPNWKIHNSKRTSKLKAMVQPMAKPWKHGTWTMDYGRMDDKIIIETKTSVF